MVLSDEENTERSNIINNIIAMNVALIKEEYRQILTEELQHQTKNRSIFGRASLVVDSLGNTTTATELTLAELLYCVISTEFIFDGKHSILSKIPAAAIIADLCAVGLAKHGPLPKEDRRFNSLMIFSEHSRKRYPADLNSLASLILANEVPTVQRELSL